MSQPMELQKLLQDFVSCYREFDEHRNSADGRYDPQQPCYFLFGLSGAGKSSLVARFLSDKGAKSFYNSVIEAKDEFVIERGVKVSRSVQATTLIPKIYKVGGLQICDMPGFKDTDQTKRIIISILQKCLVSMVKQAGRYLVVLDIACLSETRANKLISDYFVAFETLFGDKLGDYVRMMYFIFTKNDRKGYRPEDVEDRIGDVMMDAANISKNDLLGPFLHRMHHYHVVVDYSVERDVLVGSIKRMVEKGEQDALELKGLIPKHLTNFYVGEEELSQACLSVANALSKDAEDLRRSATAAHAAALSANPVANNVIAAFRRALQKRSSCADAFKETVAHVEEFGRRQSVLQSKVSAAEKALAALEKQRALGSEQNFDGIHAVSHLILAPLVDNVSPYSVKTTLRVGRVRNERRELLVVAYEADDRKLRSALGNGNLLIPKAIEDLKGLTSEIVLFNSVNGIKRDTVNVTYDVSAATNELNLKVHSPVLFKAYLYTSLPIAETSMADWIRDAHEAAVQEAKARLSEEERGVERHVLLQKQHVENLKEQAHALWRAEQELEDERQRLERVREDRAVAAADVRSTFVPLKAAFESIWESRAIGAMTDIDSIFRGNQLASNLGTQVRNLKDRLTTVRSEMKTKELEALKAQEQHHKALEDVIATHTALSTLLGEAALAHYSQLSAGASCDSGMPAMAAGGGGGGGGDVRDRWEPPSPAVVGVVLACNVDRPPPFYAAEHPPVEPPAVYPQPLGLVAEKPPPPLRAVAPPNEGAALKIRPPEQVHQPCSTEADSTNTREMTYLIEQLERESTASVTSERLAVMVPLLHKLNAIVTNIPLLSVTSVLFTLAAKALELASSALAAKSFCLDLARRLLLVHLAFVKLGQYSKTSHAAATEVQPVCARMEAVMQAALELIAKFRPPLNEGDERSVVSFLSRAFRNLKSSSSLQEDFEQIHRDVDRMEHDASLSLMCSMRADQRREEWGIVEQQLAEQLTEAFRRGTDEIKFEIQGAFAALYDDSQGVIPPADIRITKQIAISRGGQHEVFEGRLRQNVPVALKLVSSSDEATSESNVLRRLNCPNVVKCFGTWTCQDGGRLSGKQFIVLELLEISLEAALASRKLSMEKKVDILFDIICALDYCHAQRPPIVHGDLKPLNVMLTTDVRSAKLIDFDSGAILGSLRAQHLGDSFTAAYASPEVLRAEDKTSCCDIYALGVLCYQLFRNDGSSSNNPKGDTVPQPFGQLHHSLIRDAVLQGQRPCESPAELVANGIPPLVAAIIVACWAQSASARPLAAQLRTLKGSHILDMPESTWPPWLNQSFSRATQPQSPLMQTAVPLAQMTSTQLAEVLRQQKVHPEIVAHLEQECVDGYDLVHTLDAVVSATTAALPQLSELQLVKLRNVVKRTLS